MGGKSSICWDLPVTTVFCRRWKTHEPTSELPILTRKNYSRLSKSFCHPRRVLWNLSNCLCKITSGIPSPLKWAVQVALSSRLGWNLEVLSSVVTHEGFLEAMDSGSVKTRFWLQLLQAIVKHFHKKKIQVVLITVEMKLESLPISPSSVIRHNIFSKNVIFFFSSCQISEKSFETQCLMENSEWGIH